MRMADNIRAVEQTGINWMGFIFYPKSSRYVAQVPAYLPQQCQRVGVFVNADVPFIQQRITAFGLHFVQLHGNESPVQCSELRQQGVRVIKAFALRQATDLHTLQPYIGVVDYFLFDTPCPGYGGSGQSFDWSLLQAYTGTVPFLLSGGLRLDSIAALRAFSHPQLLGYDLNSGFEIAPALKDAALVQQFTEQIKTMQYE